MEPKADWRVAKEREEIDFVLWCTSTMLEARAIVVSKVQVFRQI